MKSKLSLILALALATVTSLYAAAPPVKDWQKCLGGSLQDIPGGLVRSNDGNILLLGNVDSQNGDINSNHGSTDIWLTKTDTVGNIIWQKSIGGSSIDVGTSIYQLPNGNIMIAGYSSSFDGDMTSNKGNFDVILICTDCNGNIIWLKNYGGTLVDLCYSMIRTADGGFVLGGGSYSNDIDVTGNHGDQDFWVIKTDSLGNIVWQHSAGGHNIDVCYTLAEDVNGNIYAAGTTNSTNADVNNNHGNYDLWVLKFNSNGNVTWKKTYGGTEYETAQTILIDSNQHILIGGYTRSSNGDVANNYGFGDSWLIRISPQGGLISEKTFGGTGGDNLYSIIQTLDGGFLLTSGTTSSDFDIKNRMGLEDVWLLKTDASFNIEWSHNYGGTNNERPVKVIQNADGGFLIAAYTFSNDLDVHGQHGAADIWLANYTCKVPTAFFSTSSTVCMGDTFSLVNSSTFATESNWLVNGINYSSADSISLHFPAAGNVNVTLNVQTCYYSSSISADIIIENCNLPHVSFTSQATTVCANSPVTFNDASVSATGWNWSFPGGTPSASTLQNPVVTYSQAGVYSAILTVSNSFGSQTSMRLNYITVNALPAVPMITVSGNEFTSSAATTYQWSYNSNSVANANDQNFFASADGFYTVTVSDNNQCSNVSAPVYFSMTGVAEETSNSFSVYPNPVINEVKVTLGSNSNGTIAVYAMNGQKIMENSVERNINQFSMDLSQLNKGVYRVVFTDEKGKTNQQSIIKY